MSLVSKLIYLAGIFAPFCVIPAMLYGNLYTDSWVLIDYISSFNFTILYLLVYLFYMILYSVHAWKDSRVQQPLLWTFGFVFAYWLAMVGYWMIYIRTAGYKPFTPPSSGPSQP